MNAPADIPAKTRPVAMLIGALGGQGGGVLADWIVRAAEIADLPAQSTSVPGVAQRTGATTYYLEIFPLARADLGGREPVLALYPCPGEVDVVVATEAVEAARAVENAFVSPERTLLIHSTHRIYAIGEKIGPEGSMRDGAELAAIAEKFAHSVIAGDLQQVADEAGSIVNAVLLGMIAASGALPAPVEAFERAIRDTGIAVDSNLRGLAAGIAFVRGDAVKANGAQSEPAPAVDLPPAFAEAPAGLGALIATGAERLADYQNAAYAAAYLDAMGEIFAADKAAGGKKRQYALSQEVARRLARWMAYEDVIRVADLKSRKSRFDRIRKEAGAKAGEPLRVTEFLRPGAAEIASLLPAGLGRLVERHAAKDSSKSPPGRALKLRSDTVTGHLGLRLLASLRWLRPRSGRFVEERALYTRWLAAMRAATTQDYDLALELAASAALIRGYGAVHARSRRAFTDMLAAAEGAIATSRADAAAIRNARLAALAPAA
jgi:indolepyruvate ferredoxin oxidoreductase beta subunit